ncbi:alpha/beta fold hydrolase [Pedococcus sp. 5OH_020]|uniref:alpha/beta fold hydrolase n=1 Tax=Pedococcus sp. 5OH_020 TaxID=2989814 RepID=UPI0022E9FFB6|nr:alpha/beta hydrolase [Pedococcus sp. 5OH_020]
MRARVEAVEDRFAAVAERRVRFRVQGQGPPVLLINGLGGNVATWSPLLEQLRGFEVITFDAPGAGRSQTPLRPYTMDLLTETAEQVVRAAGHERVDVLGYSLGGAVAQRLALTRPQLVRRLVLACTSCGAGAVPGALRALLAVTTPVRHYSKSGYVAAMSMIDLAPAEKASDRVREQTAAFHREAAPSPLGYALQMGAFSTFHSLPWLHRLSQPTLVMSGTDDHLVPMANSALLAAHLPHARLRVFDGWGHYLLHDPASGAGDIVADFFGSANYGRTMAWRSARAVTRAELGEYLRSAPRSAHPMAVTSALVRRLHRLRTDEA